jgi:tetratricopeptide (TPR) repeat protein
MVAQDQRRFAEAEASYRQALDISLEFGDRHSAGLTYHQVGMVAQDQRRFAEAEASYRQALDIRRETDPRAASSTASRLGMTLASLGQHREAIRALLYAAVTWHQETGHWASNVLAWLHRESTLASPDELTALIEADVPPELASDLTAAISQATDPADEGETDRSESTSA